MSKGEVRRRMVATAVRLLAENGPGGASFGDVLKASGASRGSTYHHFPDGKREMYTAALDLASGRAFAALEGVSGRPAVEVVEAFFAMWRSLLTTTDLRLGCAVLTRPGRAGTCIWCGRNWAAANRPCAASARLRTPLPSAT